MAMRPGIEAGGVVVAGQGPLQNCSGEDAMEGGGDGLPQDHWARGETNH